MDIASTVGVSLQFAAFIFKALQTVDGVLKGKSSEPVVTMELLCGEVRKECETFIQRNATDVDACSIAKQGKAICDELMTTIAKMHPTEKTAKTLSRAVFRALWSKDKLVELQRSLDNCMQALERLTLRRFEEDTGRTLHHISNNNDAILAIAQLYKQAIKHKKVGRILDALAFEGLGRRYGEVREAEGRTFRWVLGFEDSDMSSDDDSSAVDSEVDYSTVSSEDDSIVSSEDGSTVSSAEDDSTTIPEDYRVVEWLAHGDGIFHVIGKPGSGKSTLMKFIVDEPKTADLLQQWADGMKLVQASCFFWKPGNALQKTTMGLVRTLLHGMLQANPDLARALFSDAWDNLGAGAESHFSLSDRAIKDAWTRLVSSGGGGDSLSDYRCCFFIDGLDEFGDRNDTIPRLVQELKRMVGSAGGRVKICVSSREYPEIVNGLATDDTHRILLQDLTKQDIAQFVDRRLKDLCNEVSFKRSDIKRIRDEILEGAQGVFLWVVIVLGIVETEAWNDAPVDKLVEIVCKAEDKELDDFLRGVVSRVQKHNRKRVAILFKYTIMMEQLEVGGGLPLSSIEWYTFLQEFDTDNNFAAQCDKVLRHLSTPESYYTRLASTRKWIKRSCEGLLDIEDASSDGIGSVALTHRSVHEFIVELLEEKDWGDLVAGFDLAGAIVRMARAYVSIPQARARSPEARRHLVSKALRLYFQAQVTYGSDNTAAMHENFAIALATEQAVPADTNKHRCPLATMSAAGNLCHEYVEWKNRLCPQELVGRDALFYCLGDNFGRERLPPTVWQVLESGASPMDLMSGETPIWDLIVQIFSGGWTRGAIADNIAEILEMFMRVQGPLPMWVWDEGQTVLELDNDLFRYYHSPWPKGMPPPGEGSGPQTASLAEFVVALDLPRTPTLLALIDERESPEERAERAQRLVETHAHIAALFDEKVMRGAWHSGSRKLGTLVTRR